MDTTTTTTIKSSSTKSKLIFLDDFLDSCNFTRAERSFHLKHNATSRVRQRTIDDWKKRVKIKK
jgi:hypothetical protein